MKKILFRLLKLILALIVLYVFFIIFGYLFLDFDAGSSIRMGKGYFIFENPSSLSMSIPSGTRVEKAIYKKKGLGDFIQIIPSDIIGYVSDRDYIVACQKGNSSENMIQNGVFGIINSSNVQQYWIINKNNDSIFGPLDIEQYERLKKQKRINITLEK